MNILANKNFDISLRDVAHEYDSTLHYLVQKNHFWVLEKVLEKYKNYEEL